MTEKLLLINDLAGYGKVALGAMMPVLTHMGYDLYTLPTALVSNTLDYGKFQILDTTDYIEGTLAVWDELGFSFDAIATGFIVNGRQATLIADFCAAQQKHGVPVFVDPIMGDEGKLYNGVDRSLINHMRDLVGIADVAVPNYTEACLLTGAPYAGAQGMTDRDVTRLMDCMRRICPRSVVITSAAVNGRAAVIGYDHERDEQFVIPFEEIPVRFPGTGDVFSSVLMGRKLGGRTLEDATANAMHAVKDLIRINRDVDDTYKGIPLERYLGSVLR
ncbi:MAG: bifunctional hydroxymethylpyrimidine kinase/phosphomethylpyrimidine kinase [Atopobiaceae bacterium]|jgi:pyridoxine kinase|nr:bifunctional hydroxymethylpyrimidine kinase/phosphomethylpyrimidine kinase [Atopobiaceae bacterium]